jgi:hypothetical protein
MKAEELLDNRLEDVLEPEGFWLMDGPLWPEDWGRIFPHTEESPNDAK